MARTNKHDGVVYRRGDSNIWWMRYWDASGSRRLESTGTEDWDEAQPGCANGSVKDGIPPARRLRRPAGLSGGWRRFRTATVGRTPWSDIDVKIRRAGHNILETQSVPPTIGSGRPGCVLGILTPMPWSDRVPLEPASDATPNVPTGGRGQAKSAR